MATWTVEEKKTDGSGRTVTPIEAPTWIDAIREFYRIEETWSIVLDARLNRCGYYVEARRIR